MLWKDTRNPVKNVQILTPSAKVEEELIFGPSRVRHRRHVVEDDALDEHPQEHGRLPVLDQRVERLTQERLQHTNVKFLCNSLH